MFHLSTPLSLHFHPVLRRCLHSTHTHPADVSPSIVHSTLNPPGFYQLISTVNINHSTCKPHFGTKDIITGITTPAFRHVFCAPIQNVGPLTSRAAPQQHNCIQS